MFLIQPNVNGFCVVTICFHFLTVCKCIGQIPSETKESDPCLEQEKEIQKTILGKLDAFGLAGVDI